MNPWSEHVETDALVDSVRSLEAALASADPVWGHAIVARLHALAEALTQHVDTVESAYREIDATRSTLVRRIDRHRLEHANLLRQARALLETSEGRRPSDSPTAHDLRRQITELLHAVRHHQTVEDDMVFESACMDIGTGD
jgi:hypothetical protein